MNFTVNSEQDTKLPAYTSKTNKQHFAYLRSVSVAHLSFILLMLLQLQLQRYSASLVTHGSSAVTWFSKSCKVPLDIGRYFDTLRKSLYIYSYIQTRVSSVHYDETK